MRDGSHRPWPRQRVVACLGKFSQADLSAGWDDLEALLDGGPPAAKQLHLFASSQESMEPSWELVDLKNLTVERAREFETVFLALAL